MCRDIAKKALIILLITIATLGTVKGENHNPSTTTVAFGAYELSDGEDSISGNQYSIGLSIPINQQWAYHFKLSSGNASGSATDELGNNYSLKAETNTLSAGIKWNWVIKKIPWMIPYLSGGLGLQKYDYEFTNPDSIIGSTSGVGYGPLASIGMRFRISRNLTIIPGYHYSSFSITAHSGEQVGITSSGTSVALIFAF